MEKKEMKVLQRKLIKKREKLAKLSADAAELYDQLQGNCDHSKTKDHPWYHDTGYGRQTRQIGHLCTFCGWMDYWCRGRFTNPKDVD